MKYLFYIFIFLVCTLTCVHTQSRGETRENATPESSRPTDIFLRSRSRIGNVNLNKLGYVLGNNRIWQKQRNRFQNRYNHP